MMIAQLGVDGNCAMAVTYGRLVDKITFFSEYLRSNDSHDSNATLLPSP